ncbi:MAG: type II toxin-antitoxin system VapC family toxin [Spirochaetaceae bacterium]|nr:type II toxin-antitoxin system VapC family toxin [Spirochaetaceae bacterium]
MADYNEEEPHYLLDTNIVSEIIKPEPDLNVIKKIAEHNSDCAICSPVWQELLFRLYRMPESINKKYLGKFIKEDVHENFKIKNFTEKAADIQAQLRIKLEQLGKPTQKEDSMIAAIALANHMVLVTRNTKHFAAIQQVSALTVENWFEE